MKRKDAETQRNVKLSLRLSVFVFNFFVMEKSLFENLKATLGRYRGRFLKGFFLVCASNFLLIFNPLVFRQAVFDVEQVDGYSVWTWALLLVSIAAISSLFKYYMRVEFISVSRDVERQIRSKLFERIQNQSMSFYDRHGIGELLSRLTNDITAYRDVLGPGIMYPFFFITLVVPGFIALFSISKTLACIALIPLFLVNLINAAVRGRIYALALAFQKALADLSNMAQEHYSAIRIVKSYVLENALMMRFREFCRKLIGLSVRLATIQGLMFPLFTLITKITTVLLVMFSGIVIYKAWQDLSTADFVSFMWIQSYLFFPILLLGWLLPIYERGRAAYDRLREIYEEPIEVKGPSESRLTIPYQSDIEFRNLTFFYPKTSLPVIKNFNLLIRGGSFVGITGPIGGGKTTLFRLLNREYEVAKDSIFIGGREIHDYPLEAFRQELVIVEQIPFIFSKSLAENVRFGREEATQAELEMVARYADIHETILEFPQKYQTVVGERGVTLSGGQKQRLAMARAFLVDRSILLLDDIFAAVDAATERRIFESIRDKFPDKTVLLITHRISILEEMDRVIYMSDGLIVEDGSPSQLMTRNGPYAALVELQQMAGGQ